MRLAATLALAAMAMTLAATANARPGTYTDYDFDQPGLPATFDRYDMFVTWESAPVRGAIYPAFTFGFEGGGGYMGTQVGGLDRSMLFSIWDTADNSGTAVPGEGCTRFGGEGTGAHCGGPYPWVEGREYRLRVERLATVAEGDDWRGSIQDTVTGDVTFIGTIRLLNSGGHHGYGGLTKGASTFTEYFGGVESCDNQPHARIRWRGPYANAAAIPASRATASWYGYPCPAHNDQTSPSVPVVVVETGGPRTPITSANGTQLWPACSYQKSPSDDRISVANAACTDPSLLPLATTSGDVADYAAWSYPGASPVAGTATAVVNGTGSWAVFYKQPNFAGESFCLGPHRYAELYKFEGWNDVVASHRILRQSDPCSPPPECTVELPVSVCGDGVVEAACGEQCDVGPTDGSGCCDQTCRLRPAGSACQDGETCTSGDTCDAGGSCGGQSGCGDGVVDAQCEQCDDPADLCCGTMCRFASAATTCNDDDTCTSSDRCDGRGLCYGTVAPSETCGTGLQGTYFDDANLGAPEVVRTDPRIDFDWSSGAPDASIGADGFSVRWSGTVRPRYSETYTFYTTTDDGVRLWVNGQKIVDHWGLQSPTQWSGSVTLEAGKKYPIVMEYFENLGVASAKLAWSSAHQRKSIVPQSALFSSCGDGVVSTEEECDDGNAIAGDGCEPDCRLTPIPTGCAPLASARLTLSKLGGVPGDEGVRLTGKILLAAGEPAGFTPLDSVHRGAQVLIESVGAENASLYELSYRTHPVPPGPSAAVCSTGKKDGWKVDRAQTTYTYGNTTGALASASCAPGSARGLRTLKLTDKRGRPTKSIDVSVLASKAHVSTVGGPVRATVILGASAADGVAGACGQVTFASCRATAGGATVVCR